MLEHISSAIAISNDKVAKSITQMSQDISCGNITASNNIAKAQIKAAITVGESIDGFTAEYKYAHNDNFSIFNDNPELLFRLIDLVEKTISEYYDCIAVLHERTRITYQNLIKLQLLTLDDLITRIQYKVRTEMDVKQRMLFLIKCNKFLRDMSGEIIIDLMSMSNIELTIQTNQEGCQCVIPAKTSELYQNISYRYEPFNELMDLTQLFAPFVCNIKKCLCDPLLKVSDVQLTIDNMVSNSMLHRIFHPMCFDIDIDDDGKTIHRYGADYNALRRKMLEKLFAVLCKYMRNQPIQLPEHRKEGFSPFLLKNFIITRLVESLIGVKCYIACTFNHVQAAEGNSTPAKLTIMVSNEHSVNIDKLQVLSDIDLYNFVFDFFHGVIFYRLGRT